MPYQDHSLPPSDPQSPEYDAWRAECERHVAAQRRLEAYTRAFPRQALQAYAERHGLSMERVRERLHDEERLRYAYSHAVQQRLLAEAQAEIEARERLAGGSAGHKAESWIDARRREAQATEDARLARERARERAGSEVPWDIKHAPADLTLLEVKTVGGVARFTGYASTFNNVDLTDDVVLPGAFSATLADARAKGRSVLYPVLYQHQPDRLIGGIVDAREDSKGLRVEGILATDTQAGADAFSLAQKGILSGLSIGYRVSRSDYQGSTRRLKAIKLHEISLVQAPANPAAGVDSMTSGY